MVELAIQTRGLGKAYRRYAGPVARAQELFSFGLWKRHELAWALADVDLELERGAMLGVVGENGAGKSTLLRLLAGASRPSAGALCVRGKVASLLELGAGFHPELTGRENIALAACLAGHARRSVEGPALEFAGLGSAADDPVRTYSSGMAVRLGFAVATAVRPDVLLLDEVLAVGDLVFQERCVERVQDFRRRGTAIVFASHSLYDVRQLCDRALWLSGGRPAELGPPNPVTNAYAARQRALAGARSTAERRAQPAAARDARLPALEAVEVVRADGAPARSVRTGESLAIRVRWTNPSAPARRVALGVALVREDKTIVAAAATHHDGIALAGPGGTALLELPELCLLSGTFRATAWLFDGEGAQRWDERAADEALEVLALTREVGLVRLAHGWKLEPAPALPASSGPPSAATGPGERAGPAESADSSGEARP